MKKVIIILTLFLPLSCVARFGWSFTDYSLLVGQQYRFGQRPLWAFEFQYDRFSKNCLSQGKYFGIGANYSFNDKGSELGLKAMWNPTRLTILASRSTKFYPYLFGQGNYFQTKTKSPLMTDNKSINHFSFRPGLGLTGNFRENKVLSIRTYLQLGYNIPFDNSKDFKNSLILEFKLGFGVNSRQIKRNQQKSVETENFEKL